MRDRVDKIHARHSTNDSEVTRRLFQAWCDYVEAVDAVRWPVVVIEKQNTLINKENAARDGVDVAAILRRALRETEEAQAAAQQKASQLRKTQR